MRILLTLNPQEYKRQVGWINALNQMGHQAHIWDGQKPIHDVFYEFNPQTLITWTQNLTPPLVKCILKYKPDVYMGLNLFGELPQKLGLPQAQEHEKSLASAFPVRKVFTQYAPEYTQGLVGGWGQTPTSILPAHDPYFVKSKPFGLAYVGNWSPNKPLQWIADANKKYDIKVFGQGWFIPECLGRCTVQTEMEVLSGDNLVFYDDYEQWGLSDRVFNSLALGGNPISMRTPVSQARFTLNYFDTYDEMIECIRKPKKISVQVDTYKDRMEQLLG